MNGTAASRKAPTEHVDLVPEEVKRAKELLGQCTKTLHACGQALGDCKALSDKQNEANALLKKRIEDIEAERNSLFQRKEFWFGTGFIGATLLIILINSATK